MTTSTSSIIWHKLPRRLRALLTASAFFVALDLFFVSIKMLSAFKSLGSGYGHDLIVELASNPFIGLFVGVLVTSVVQSSSSTTSLVVGLVAAGTLGTDPDTAVRMAVPIIMGANIGTSVTNLLVSFGHFGDKQEFRRAFTAATVHDMFNLLAVAVLLPLQAATNFLGRLSLGAANLFNDIGGLVFSSPLKLLVRPQQKLIESLVAHGGVATFLIATGCALVCLFGLMLVVGRSRAARSVNGLITLFAMAFGGGVTAVFHYPTLLQSSELATLFLALGGLFASLYGMVRIMRSVVMSRIESLFHGYIFKTALRAFSLGLLFTALVQSSSVTTSLIVPLAGAGILTLVQVFPYTLGANVGTTVTAMLAALSLGEPAAVAVASAHFFFNILGIAIWYPLRRVPMSLAEGLAGLAVRYPAIAPLFVVMVFFLIPIAIILASR